MRPEVDVRFAYTSLGSPYRPDVPLAWSNERLLTWARDAGYGSAEFHPLRWPTYELTKLHRSVRILADTLEIRSGHTRFNPYATAWEVIARRHDKLRPGERYALYNLAFAEPANADRVLHLLQRAHRGLSVVVYPGPRGVVSNQGFSPAFLQTHPDVFQNDLTAEDVTRIVQGGIVHGVVWDTYHALAATWAGVHPFGGPHGWREPLETMLSSGIVKEMHVQIGRTAHADILIPSLQWLKEMTGSYPHYTNEIGRMVALAKAYDPTIPFVIEVSIDGLLQTGLIARRSLLSPSLEDVKTVHRELINFIRRV